MLSFAQPLHDGSWRVKNAPKLPSKYFMNKICKRKKKKRKKKKLYTKETTSKAAAIEFLSKIPHRKKTSNEDFNLCEEET